MSDSTRIILLRAVNVGGAKLPMAELRSMMTELGATDVRTYIASGNAVCELAGDPDRFDRALEKAIQQRFGFFRESISRTPSELVASLAAHPFEVIEPRFSYISFLTAEPTEAAIEKARKIETGRDKWEVIGRELHIRYIGGAGRPEMKSDAIGRALGVPGTARNLNTVRALIDLAGVE
jgi:uncharacterized protein (DUF1697 family)